MMKEIIAVANDKGGVGKTTTAQNLAMGLTMKGKRVLVIDADSQRYASFLNKWDSNREKSGDRTLFDAMSSVSALPVYKSSRGVYFTPSSERMATIDPYLNSNLSPNTVLKQVFELPIAINFDNDLGKDVLHVTDFDYVIIDCPPALGAVTINAMAVATGIVVPAQLEAFSVRGLGNVTAKFKDVQRTLNPSLTIRGFLLVMAMDRLVSTKVYAEALRDAFSDLVFDTRIRRNVRVSESQDSDSDIFEYDPSSIGAKDYMAFTEEFLSKSPVKL